MKHIDYHVPIKDYLIIPLSGILSGRTVPFKNIEILQDFLRVSFLGARAITT